MIELKLDLLQTLALAVVVYFIGIVLSARVAWIGRLNIPAAVVGGLLFNFLVLLTHDRFLTLTLNTTAQPVLSVAFFTTIGMSASLALLRVGGIPVVIFLLFASVFCIAQNLLGMVIARGFGENPLLGVMVGSVTLVGGPATGLAFAPLFEEAGLKGAGALAIAAATVGIVCGGLLGGPVGTVLMRRVPPATGPAPVDGSAAPVTLPATTFEVEVEREDTPLVRNLVVLALAMGLGSLVSGYFVSLGITLPAYIGAMMVASVLRNVDDWTAWLRIDERVMEFVGGLALNIFLVVALMNLELWELAGQALPLIVILIGQVALVALAALTVSFRLMGGDHDAAVMAGGFIGFVLGTTANAVANMRALVLRYGPAPRAFLVVPLVGAFFIDFVNALIITFFLNWLS